MNAAIFSKSLSSDHFPFLLQLIEALNAKQIGVKIYEPFYKEISSIIPASVVVDVFTKHTEIRDQVDLLFSIGGDGTLLDTITLVRDSEIPILGVNMGKLGFLSNVSREEIVGTVTQLLNKEYTLETRSLLRVDSQDHLFGDINYAMNDLMVYKKAPLSMIVIHTYINEQFLNSYWADGLIVSTPTGSTAYSMSCGGPIITPDCRNFVITPIASHNLTVRPIVIPDSSVIRLSVEDRNHDYFIGLDSRSISLHTQIELTIKKEEFGVRLIKPLGKDFFGTIREKLNWGLDKRN
ncbi:MAG: NAD kinase [Bacteroidota bacterium]